MFVIKNIFRSFPSVHGFNLFNVCLVFLFLIRNKFIILIQLFVHQGRLLPNVDNIQHYAYLSGAKESLRLL